MNTEKKAYTLSILVEDTPGVLSQVARLFSRKGYNIESICSGPAMGTGTARISVVTIGDEAMIHQIATQLSKLLLVISVDVLSGEDAIQRDMVLVKVKAETRDAREDIIQITNVFRGSIVDFGTNTLIIAVVGAAEKIKAMLKLLGEYGILETAHTGMVALERGENTIYNQNKLKEEYNYGKNVL
jgi:acetolactate synthase-1/3 small subunit